LSCHHLPTWLLSGGRCVALYTSAVVYRSPQSAYTTAQRGYQSKRHPPKRPQDKKPPPGKFTNDTSYLHNTDVVNIYTSIKITVECLRNAVIATATSYCRYDVTVAAVAATTSAAAAERIQRAPKARESQRERAPKARSLQRGWRRRASLCI